MEHGDLDYWLADIALRVYIRRSQIIRRRDGFGVVAGSGGASIRRNSKMGNEKGSQMHQLMPRFEYRCGGENPDRKLDCLFQGALTALKPVSPPASVYWIPASGG